MNHVAGTMGSLMLIHGGYNTEEIVKVLEDFCLFDLELNQWVSVGITSDALELEHFEARQVEMTTT
jgi:hypothetical protein